LFKDSQQTNNKATPTTTPIYAYFLVVSASLLAAVPFVVVVLFGVWYVPKGEGKQIFTPGLSVDI